MEQKTAADFDPEVLILFDAYVHGAIDRRGFLDKAGKFAVGGVTAAMLLDALNPKFAEAQQVAKDDKRIQTEYLEYPSPQGYGKMRGYLVRPANAAGKLPAILVVHENRGLNPHIEDIARRLALDNFMAFAPDALFPLGGYPGDEDKARELFPKLDQTKTREDFVPAANFLNAPGRYRPARRGRLLLRRRHRQHAGDAGAGACRRRAVLRQPADVRRCTEDQGGSAAAVRRDGRTDQRGVAAVRGRIESRERDMRRTRIPGRSTASTTTRRRATTRSRRSSRGSGRWRSSTPIFESSWRRSITKARPRVVSS